MAEGLENKLAAVSKIARNREELLAAMKSRRHPYTRLSRLLLACFLGITKEQIQSIDAQPPYARVLGVRQERRDLLSHLAHHSRIPVITQPREDRLSPAWLWISMLRISMACSANLSSLPDETIPTVFSSSRRVKYAPGRQECGLLSISSLGLFLHDALFCRIKILNPSCQSIDE